MGKINVVRDDGSVVAVDEQDYVNSRSREHSGNAEDPFDAVQRIQREERKAAHTGVGYQLAAGALAAADTATAGLLGKGISAISPEVGQDMQELLQDNKAGTTLGSLGGVFLPGLGTAGKFAKAGIEARTGSKLAGMTAEGGIVGGGMHVAHTNITGDPLSIEGLAEDIGVGGAIGLGFGIASKGISKLASMGKGTTDAARNMARGELEWESLTAGSKETPLAKAARARQKVDDVIAEEKDAAFAKQEATDAANYANEEKARKADITRRKKQYGDELKATANLVDDMPSWNATRDAHNGLRTQIREANKLATAEQKAYDKFANPEGVRSVNAALEKAQNQIRATARAYGPEVSNDLYEITQARNAAREAGAAGDFDNAAEALKQAQGRIRKYVPDLELPEIPMRPTSTVRPVPPELPKKLTDLGRKHPGSINKLVEGMDDATAAQLEKVATDLGLEPGATLGDTIGYVHKKLHDVFYAPGQRLAAETAESIPYRKLDEMIDDEVAAGTRSEEWAAASAEVDAQRSAGGYSESSWGPIKAAPKQEGLLSSTIDFTKRLAKYTAGRAADVGGAKGVLFRMLAGEATGVAMSGVESAVAGGAMTGKVGLRAKIGEAFAGFAQPAQKTLEMLGPVTISLKQSFPFGHEDPAEDERDLVLNRLDELYNIKQQAPDLLYGMVKGIMGSSGDVAFKLHQQFMKGLQYLTDNAPKDPGINITMRGSRFRPGLQAARDYAHVWEAVMHSTPYLARVLAGDGSAAGMQALSVVMPALVEEARAEAMRRDWSQIDLQGHRGLSMLFQRPMSGLQDPDVLWLLQSQPSSMAPQQAAGPTAGGLAGFGKPGRPAAYDSAPAGSNVSGLINR